MPAINTGQLYLPTIQNMGSTSTTRNMSATTDIVALICEIPQTGNITGIKFATAAVTTGCTLVCTIETVTGSKPSGTLYHANATNTVVVANSDDNVVKSVSYTSFTGTKGDLVGIKLAVSSGTPTSLGIRTTATGTQAAFPSLYVNSATVDGWGGNCPCILITYDTGDVVPLAVSFYSNNANLSVSSSTTPDEVGISFTAPFSAKTDGFVWRVAKASNAQACDMVLYDSSNNVLASYSMSKEAVVGTGINNYYYGFWTATANILKGRTYRLVLKPTTTTTWTNMISQFTAGLVLSWDGDSNPVYTSRTDGGAWTDSSGVIVPMALSISQIYQPGGSFL